MAKTIMVTVRITPEVKEILERQSNRKQRSMSGQIAHLILEAEMGYQARVQSGQLYRQQSWELLKGIDDEEV